jgi:predicted metalloprotease with PDZ domain
MRFTYVVALALLPTLLGSTSCAQSSKHSEKKITVRVKHDDGAWLGVSLQDMTPKLAKTMDVKTESGALVKSVSEDSPAEKAGIKEDDIIVEFDGKHIAESGDLVTAVGDAKPEAAVEIVVVRKDARQTLKATLGERPEQADIFSMPPSAPHAFRILEGSATYGLSLQTLNRQLGAYFGAPNGHGVLVEEVRKKSPAEKTGFKAGDVIVKIGSESVEDIHDVRSALEDYKKGDKATFEIIRKGDRVTIGLEIEERQHGSMFGVEPFRSYDDLDIDLQDVPGVERENFHMNMEKLGRELKDMGKKLKENILELKERLRRDLRNVSGV